MYISLFSTKEKRKDSESPTKTKKKERKEKKKLEIMIKTSSKSRLTEEPMIKSSSDPMFSTFAAKIPIKDLSNRLLKSLPDDITSNVEITKLYLKCNNLKKLKGCDNLVNLQVLDISNNHFKTFPQEVLSLSKLKDLILAENRLTEIPSGISDLGQITKLDLSGNNLSTFPVSICTLANLQWLNVSYNKVDEIPREVAGLTSLTHLYLQHNCIIKVTGSICQLSSLRELALNHNQLETLTHSIGELELLVNLNLSFNKLKVIPEGLKKGGSLKSLHKLDLGNNCMESIDEDFFDSDEEILPSLEELSMNNNLLQSLPNSFWSNMSNLTLLDLRNNKLQDIPPEIGNFLYLNILDLSMNKIEVLPDQISQITSAQVINLFGNNLKALPPVNEMNYLQYLNVGYNEITDLNLGSMEALEELVLSGNEIKKLPDSLPEYCPNLKILYANNMSLKEIPKTFSDLSLLEHLDVSFNKLTEIPTTLGDIEGLRTLSVSHNRLESSKERESGKLMSVGPWDCIEFWQSFAQIQEIDISYNKLKFIPKGLESKIGSDCKVILHGNPLVEKLESKNLLSTIPIYGTRFKVGSSDMMGRRPTMEDVICIHASLGGDDNIDLYGVFDGHAGNEAAEYVAFHLPSAIQSRLPLSDPQTAFTDAFQEVNDGLKQHLSQMKYSSKKHCGTTAVVALIAGNQLHIANVGDSRAVLDTGERLTVDHKPRDEVERIRRHEGGYVSGEGGGRINGVLAVSRALGDFYMQPWVSCQPHVCTKEINKESRYLILACDGIWDEISDHQAVTVVEELVMKGKVDLAAQKLRDTAYAIGSDDNITVMIIKLAK